MINRKRLPSGVWEYLDQDEECFLFELWSCEEISLESIDDFIESKALPEWVRDDLLAMRTDALGSYRAKDYELASARAAALQWACKFYGQTIAGTPRIRDSEKRSEEQRHRRLGKPAIDSSFDPERNTRMKAFYKRQVTAGADNPLQATSNEFGLSNRQVRRIVHGK